MNCATHSDTAAVAFCRTCGKPLCNQCTRDVRGVIYCEACLAARMEGGQLRLAGFVPPPAQPQTVYPLHGSGPRGESSARRRTSGPNPAVAGILAGFFPIGVGAVYTGQYAKGLSHLVIMVLLILGVSSDLAVVRDHGPRDLDRIFLRLPDHRRGSHREGDPDGRACSRSRLDWRRRSAPARNSKAPRFPPELPFSSAWACFSCCTLPDSSNSAWIVSGRSS